MLKASLLIPNCQVANAKEQFLKDITSTMLVNTRMISNIALLLIWRSFSGLERRANQPQHSLSQSKVLTLFYSMKAERGQKVAEKCEASRGWFMGLKERRWLDKVRGQGEAASGEPAASHPEDLAKTIDDGGCTEQWVSSADRTLEEDAI